MSNTTKRGAHWLEILFGVARAFEASAKLLGATMAIDPFGVMALIDDSDGNIVGLHAR